MLGLHWACGFRVVCVHFCLCHVSNTNEVSGVIWA